jgi:O-antigen ligase
VVPRLRMMVLGGGQHQASNNARSEQWRIALGRLKDNPIGHGQDSAGAVVGYVNQAGVSTVDSYYIALLMDYGVLGFVAYGAFYIFAAFLAFRTFVRAENEEERLAGPLAISLTSFIVIKSVLMQQENHHLAFALAGMSAAIAWRQELRLRAAAREAAQPAVPAAPATGGWVAARSAQQP